MGESLREESSICIVDTQTQLINVIELINELSCAKNSLIIGSILPNRVRQVRNLLKRNNVKLHFTHIYYTYLIRSSSKLATYLNSTYRFILIPFIVLKNRNASISVIGNYLEATHRYFQFVCSKLVTCRDYYLVDDGIGTLSCAKERVEENSKGIATIRINSTWEKCLYGIFFTRANYIPHNITFYTIYDVQYKFPDLVIFNAYNYLKENSISEVIIRPNSIIIIGQCFVEENILTKTTYQDYINFIINYNLDCPVYYFQHPGESENYVDFNGNVIVISAGIPIEMLLIKFLTSIKVFGFYSSALYSLKTIEPRLEVYSIKLDYCHLCNSLLAPQIENIYKSFEVKGIKLISRPLTVAT